MFDFLKRKKGLHVKERGNMFDKITYEKHGHCWIPTKHTNGIITRQYIEWVLCDYVYHTLSCKLKPHEFVVHTCNDHRCINPDHLVKVNAYDQIYDGTVDKLARITHAKLHGNAVLNEHDVNYIRSSKTSAELLATMYGVDLEVILQIKRRNTWNGLKLR